MLYIEYPKCSTCKNIKSFLSENLFEFETRHIVEENPTYDEIKLWHEKSGLDIKKFFNTSGIKYKELNLKEKLLTMTLDEKYKLLSTDGMLVKRPILIFDDKIIIAKEILNII